MGARDRVSFALREHASEASRQGLAILDLALAARLARALDDSSQHGSAKALVLAGRKAGFDMATEAGVAAYVRAVNRHAPKRRVKPREPRQAPSKKSKVAKAPRAKSRDR